jgi:hypothetical protein
MTAIFRPQWSVMMPISAPPLPWSMSFCAHRKSLSNASATKSAVRFGLRTGIASPAISRRVTPRVQQANLPQRCSKLGIPPKTAENQIKRFTLQGLLIHYAHDKYKKP